MFQTLTSYQQNFLTGFPLGQQNPERETISAWLVIE
jgi:hypothetical protein